MKLTNFRNYEVKQVRRPGWSANFHDDVQYADVDVTTGTWFWKKTVTRQICCINGMYWFFVDNGELTPDRDAEQLAKSYKARNGIAI